MSELGRANDPICPIMGNIIGNGESGVVKDTCRMGLVLTSSWIVFRAYVAIPRP